MNKFFIFGFLLVLLLSFSFALTFPGKSINFKDFNMPTIYEKDTCVTMNLTSIQKDTLKSNPGILGLLLHIKTSGPDDFVYVQSDLGIVNSRNIFGFNINYRNLMSDAQSNYLFINLETVKKGNLELFLCASSKDKIELFDDSQIGSYRIPYFGEDNFTKSFQNLGNYKINEKTPVEVKLTNAGYSNAEIFLFYDNELFTNWFKLKDGTPSMTKILPPTESVSLEYNVVPLTGKSFSVSPAVVRYSVNGYIFSDYSNGLISNARAYLDEIFVKMDVSSTNLDINKEGIITITIQNDSDKPKAAVLLVSNLELFGLDNRYEIQLAPMETKIMTYKISSPKEGMFTFNVSLVAGDAEKTEKEYASQTVYFGKELNNYNYIYVIVAVLLVIGVAIYYKYLL